MDFCNIFSSFSFTFDWLSIFFIFVILLIAIPSAIYSLGYLRGYSTKKIIYCWVLMLGFVFSMLLVVIIKNALFFLIFWELMSLISYFLVIFDSKDEKSSSAGILYIVMTHIGTALIIISILTMFKYTGFSSFDFVSLKNACKIMPLNLKSIVFLCLFFGFGTKAGIVPLHIWLPQAHPAAPSHISSIMSGVMIKTAIYGMIRFIISILGIEFTWWGILVLIIAGISCLVGVIYALMEHDIKKLLAYHSVENIGIILLGIGSSMVFMKLNLPYLTILSMAAGLYHLINHAIFKSLLFLCAGSIYKSTGTRDIEKLGGLIKKMPYTALSFLIGAMAISAIPPLNGFVSEWLIFQTFFLGALNTPSMIKIFMFIMVGILALTSGLAAACFIKAFGITFLAMPRSNKVIEAKEVSASMKFSMIFLSFLTFVFGFGASLILDILTKISGSITNIDIKSMSFKLNNFVIKLSQNNNVFLSTPLIMLLIIFFAVISVYLIYLRFKTNKVKIGKTWDCGYYQLDSRTEYTATGFSMPFRMIFKGFLKPYRKIEKIRASYYHVTSFKHELSITKIFEQYFYNSIIKLIYKISKLIRKIQFGSIHFYLGYIFLAIVLLLIFLKRF